MLRVIKIFAFAVVITVVALLVFSQPAMSREFGAIYTECGLGAMIAPNHPGVAAVTNVTWDLGTTAISSAATTPGACQGGQEKTAAFINDSYESLEQDLASGSGTYLDTLTTLAGCEPQVHQELIDALRDDFTNTVAGPGYTNQSRFEQAQNLYDLLYKHVDGNFSGTCSGNNI
ncbi:hypothetical protein BMS3Bbin08_00019 [bacterium BMS3Bbin08]|nr:hypothetical protein BMS3Bbin08_00019 [bacterium BMS3Bbin08]